MVVQILWSSTSYGCPHLIVVHILWFDLMIVRFLWLYLMVSYGCPMKMKILWFDLMVVHVDGCLVDGCLLTR